MLRLALGQANVVTNGCQAVRQAPMPRIAQRRVPDPMGPAGIANPGEPPTGTHPIQLGAPHSPFHLSYILSYLPCLMISTNSLTSGTSTRKSGTPQCHFRVIFQISRRHGLAHNRHGRPIAYIALIVYLPRSSTHQRTRRPTRNREQPAQRLAAPRRYSASIARAWQQWWLAQRHTPRQATRWSHRRGE